MKLKVEGGKVAADEAWTTKDLVCHHGGYVIHEGHIYGNHGGGWTCLELETGERKWYERAVGKGSLCWADGMEVNGQVSVRGSGPSWAHPVVIGGRLYLRYDTNLYCFNVSAR